MFKKDMIASKGTTKHVHKGKGSQMAPMPNRSQISQLAQPPGGSMNDYAKATPLAAQPPDTDGEDMGM